LVLSDFLVTTTRDVVWSKCHIFRFLHDWRALTTVLVTESLVLTIGVPVIVVLIMAMVFVERVVQVTVQPEELWHDSQVKWHLGVIIGLVVVARSDWVQLLVKIRVDNGVAPVVMGLLPVVLWEV